MDPAMMAAMMGGAGGISREQAAAFAQMAAMASSGGAPAAAPPPKREPTPEELEAEKERYIQGYAKYLEELKVKDPEEYKAVMTELQQAARQAQQGFEPVMPGGDKKLGAGGVDSAQQEEGMEISPTPGFVVKTSNSGGTKVFINVCHHEALKEPSKKKQLQADGTEQEGLNIPLSLGPPLTITTKKGDKAVVFDCIVNSSVVADVAEDRTGAFRHFVCELCIQYVETKYKTQLNHQYKLPRAKYKGGEVRTQMIRKRQAPVIEEVLDNDDTPKKKRSSAAAAAKVGGGGGKSGGAKAGAKRANIIRVQEPDEHARHSVQCRDSADGEPYAWEDGETAPASHEGRNPVEVVVRVLLNKMPADEVPTVDIAEELVVIKATGHFPLEVYLPVPVSADSPDVQADFDRVTSTLELVLPVAPEADDPTKPDLGSKPWLLSQALNVGDRGDDDSGKTSDGAGSGAQPANSSTAYGSSGAPVTEDDTLPEDRFHKSDIMSQHLLMERAKDRAERRKQQEEKDRVQAKQKAAEEKAAAEKKRADEVAAREAAIAAAAAQIQEDDGQGEVVLSSTMALDLID